MTHRKKAVAKAKDSNGKIIPKSAVDDHVTGYEFYWEVSQNFNCPKIFFRVRTKIDEKRWYCGSIGM